MFSENSKKLGSQKLNKFLHFEELIIIIVFLTGIIYIFSNPKPQYYYDYTFRVAANFFRGEIGFQEKQPAWLNEMIPFEGVNYSAFPLGSVLSMLPFAFLKVIGLIKDMPAALIAGLIALFIGQLLFLISRFYEHTPQKRILMVLGTMFGTWLWTNLAMAGAWQIALGYAMIGELGAIYYTVYNRNVILAGAFFALAFGNRTEILLIAPIFMFLIYKLQNNQFRNDADNQKPEVENRILEIAKFCTVPFLLGIATLIYNYLRFHSPFDFGYSHIPGVLDEPWYRHGIFSIYYIPYNFNEMLLTPWRQIAEFPYYTPTGFGGSILMTSPFLLLTLRRGAQNFLLKYASWFAIIVMTFLLWVHGNAGGWQFSYRYAIILLPWFYLILLETSPKKISVLEWITYGFSFIINFYATYLFLWTDYVKP